MLLCFCNLRNPIRNHRNLGQCALFCNTTSNQLAIGHLALRDQTGAPHNLAIGPLSMTFTCGVTAAYNIAIGFCSLYCNLTGTDNHMIGTCAGRLNQGGRFNTTLGSGNFIDQTAGSFNTAIGANAMRRLTTGQNNTAVGVGTMACVTSGNLNVAIGRNTLRLNRTGCYNVAVGDYAATSHYCTGIVAVGFHTLRNSNNTQNTGVGYKVLCCVTTSQSNTGIGFCALNLATGCRNTGIGDNALSKATAISCNVAVGFNSGCSLGTGDANVILGNNIGDCISGQNCNIIIADGAGNIRMFTTGSTGNTGINTLRPTSKLFVSGTSDVFAVQGSGSASNTSLLTVDGASGRLFQVTDTLSGSLFSVNTAGGLPVMEAFSDNTVRIGQYGQKAFFVSQSVVGVGTETFVQTGSVPAFKLEVSGSIGPSVDAVFNLGSSGSRWNVVYTTDLNLNNNIGDWTIVEGEDDLFIYNNKKDKVYKFNLIEVDPSIAPAKRH